MNSVLEEIIRDGTTKTTDGQIKKVIGQISAEEGKLIQNSIKEINAEVSVEVGLAFGTSALYICEALTKTGKTRHYVIDPFQMYPDSYGGIGLNNLKRAGFENIVEFIDKPSHQGLVLLDSQNVKADFAFIDGWHTFDYTLVDFFLVDKILKVGGIVILDDSDWPAVHKVCSFISNNLSYKFIGGSAQRSYLKKNSSDKNFIRKFKKKLFNKEPDKTPLYGATAFKKIADDNRRWDHYIDFN